MEYKEERSDEVPDKAYWKNFNKLAKNLTPKIIKGYVDDFAMNLDSQYLKESINGTQKEK